MKKIVPVLMLFVLTALISVSCKSAPEPQPPEQPPIVQKLAEKLEEQPEAQTVADRLRDRLEQVNTDLLNEPKARAEAARQRAVDFESPAYFPSEWETAEAGYNSAKEMPLTNPIQIQDAVSAFNSSAELYDEIFNKTVPLYAQAREDEILATREKLIITGFTEYFPDYLADTDKLTLSALDQYEAEDYYTAKETAKKALKEYETLLLGADVFLARQEITNRNFTKYDRENFAKADEVAEAAVFEYESGNKENAIEQAQEALLRYNLVLSNAWTAHLGELQMSAAKEREQALAERANISSRDIFNNAETLNNQAQAELASGDFQSASLKFADARAGFIQAKQDTINKRQIAARAIRKAEEKIEESGETLTEAERVIEGGSR